MPSREVAQTRLASVLRRIVPAEDLLLFEQSPLARIHPVVVHGRGRHHRLVREAHRVGVVLGIHGEREGVVRLLGRDAVRRPRFHVYHSEERQTAFPLVDDAVSGEERHALDFYGGVGIDEGRPPGFRGILQRRADDSEILRSFVGANVQPAFVMIRVVLVAGLPGQNDPKLAGRVVGRKEPLLGGRLRERAEEDDLPVERAAHRNVEQLVPLLEHQFAGRCGDDVPPDFVGSLRDRIFRRVEECPIVARPHDSANTVDLLAGRLAGSQILHVQRELPVARRVERIRQPMPVVADDIRADAKIGMALCQRIQVEEQLLGRVHAALPPAHDRVLFPLLGARVVEVVAEPRRHAQVGLLDAPEHLRIERLLQRLGGLHHLLRIGVLGLEVLQDLRVGLVAQPEVVVCERVSVDLRDMGFSCGHRWRWVRRLGANTRLLEFVSVVSAGSWQLEAGSIYGTSISSGTTTVPQCSTSSALWPSTIGK